MLHAFTYLDASQAAAKVFSPWSIEQNLSKTVPIIFVLFSVILADPLFLIAFQVVAGCFRLVYLGDIVMNEWHCHCAACHSVGRSLIWMRQGLMLSFFRPWCAEGLACESAHLVCSEAETARRHSHRRYRSNGDKRRGLPLPKKYAMNEFIQVKA